MEARDGNAARSGLTGSAAGFCTASSDGIGTVLVSSVTFLTAGLCLSDQSRSHLMAAALVANLFLKRKSSILSRRFSSMMKLIRVLDGFIYADVRLLYYMRNTVAMFSIDNSDYVDCDYAPWKFVKRPRSAWAQGSSLAIQEAAFRSRAGRKRFTSLIFNGIRPIEIIYWCRVESRSRIIQSHVACCAPLRDAQPCASHSSRKPD
jgi:hypothetical protein